METSLAQQGYCSLWFAVFGEGFAYYGLLEKDLSRERSQIARRSVPFEARAKTPPHLQWLTDLCAAGAHVT